MEPTHDRAEELGDFAASSSGLRPDPWTCGGRNRDERNPAIPDRNLLPPSKIPAVPTTSPRRFPKARSSFSRTAHFQIAREYSIVGDRVRYWSVERAEWEEIPADLVDWDATKKAEAEQEQQDRALEENLQRARTAEETAGVDEIDASLEVKPGIFLPDGFGMFAGGEPESSER